MKCLSIWQPWASLIGCGVKTVETRSWAPPVSVIGTRIGIHASLRKPSSMGLTPYLIGAIERVCRKQEHGFGRLGVDTLDELPRGCVIATAVIDQVWQVQRIRGPIGGAIARGNCDQRIVEQRVDRLGDFSVGKWLWFLRDVQLLDEPVMVRGQQRLFEVEMPAMAEVV